MSRKYSSQEIAQDFKFWQDTLIRAEMEAKSKAHKRGAGARALKAKYGKAGADIIQRHTGRKINLK